MMKTIVVLGALGGVGQAVAEAFLTRGYTVKAFVRPGREKELPKGMVAVAADLFDTEAAARACGKADLVFDGLNAPYHQWPEKALPLYEAALALCERLGAVHLFPGNVYNFGAGMPLDLTLDTPFAPTSEKGRIRCVLENRLQEVAQQGRVRTIILRAGDFFGPQASKSWFNAVIASRLAKGTVLSPGHPDAIHAFAYLPDLAQAFVSLAEARANGGDPFEVYHFAGHAITMRELANAGSQLTGKPVKVWRLPHSMFTVMGWFDPMVRASHEMAYLWNVPHRLVDDRAEALFGKQPHTPLVEALRYRMT